MNNLSFANPKLGIPVLIAALLYFSFVNDITETIWWLKYIPIIFVFYTFFYIISTQKSNEKIKVELKDNTRWKINLKDITNVFKNGLLILGRGGKFDDRERQAIYTIEQNKEIEEYMYEEDVSGKGNKVLHSVVKGHEKYISLTDEQRKGHLLITGATRTGKGVVSQFILHQLIPNHNQVVIFVDPKNDNGIFNTIHTLCERHDREFYLFSPSYDTGLCYNPLSDIISATDAADRISSILPTSHGSEPWNDLAMDITVKCISGMMRIGMRITLKSVYESLFLRPDEFMEEVIDEIAKSSDGLLDENGEYFNAEEFIKDDLRKKTATIPMGLLSNKDKNILSGILTNYADRGNPKWAERVQVFKSTFGSLCEDPYDRLLSPSEGAKQISLDNIIKGKAVVLFRLGVRRNKRATQGICKMLAKHLSYYSNKIDEHSAGGHWEEYKDIKVNVMLDEFKHTCSDWIEELYSMSAASNFWLVTLVQTVSQIYDAVSNPNIANSIIGAHHHTLYLRIKDPTMAKEIEDYYGTVEVKKPNFKQRMNTKNSEGSATDVGQISATQDIDAKETRVPLINKSDIGTQPVLQGFLEIEGELNHIEIPIVIDDDQKNAFQELGLKITKDYISKEDLELEEKEDGKTPIKEVKVLTVPMFGD